MSRAQLFRSAALFAPLVLAAAPLRAQEPIPAAQTHHSLSLAGGALGYEAVFEQAVLPDDKGAPAATLSTIAYLRDGAAKDRPVLFAFNGGPGASSSPLHVGAMGPRVREGQGFVDNPQTLLDQVDLVFLDPVGTGFSRPLGDKGGAPFWNVDGDARAMAEAITGWLKAHGRTGAPVYIAGESYGGARLAAMLPRLNQVNLAGLLFISPALSIEERGYSDLVQALPAMAVAAAAHGRGIMAGQAAPQVYARAAEFATNDYALALLRGSALSQAERTRIAGRLSGLLGLPAKMIEDNRLRVDVETFRDALLAADDKVVGRLDSRVTAARAKVVAPAGRPSAANDPALGLGSSNVIVSASLGDYMRRELGVATTMDYVALTLDVNFQWSWPRIQGADKGPDLLGNLREAMAVHPAMKVLMVGGYYDMTIPVLATRQAIDQAWLPAGRVELAALETGHSAFEGEAGRVTMHRLLAPWFNPGGVPAKPTR